MGSCYKYSSKTWQFVAANSSLFKHLCRMNESILLTSHLLMGI